MTTDLLELGISVDPRGVQTGVAAANASLDTISSKFQSVTDRTTRFDGTLRELTKASSGTLQLAQGVSNAARSFGELSAAGSAFAALGIGIDVVKLVDDYKDLTDAVSLNAKAMATTTTVYGVYGEVLSTKVIAPQTAALSTTQKLWAVMAANPLLAAGAALAAIGAAFSLISTTGSKAAEAFKRFADEAKGLKAESSVAKAFDNDELVLAAARKRRDRLFDIATTITSENKYVSVSSLAESLGTTERNVSDLLLAGRTTTDQGDPLPKNFTYRGSDEISPQRAVKVLSRAYDAEGRQVRGLEDDKSRFEEQAKLMQDEVRIRQYEEDRRFAMMEERMNRIRQVSYDIGAALGNGIVQFASGAASAEQILRNILLNFVSQAAQTGLGNLFKAGGEAIFSNSPAKGTTPAQAKTNAGR